MFLNHIKNFWVKKTLNKKLQSSAVLVVPSSVKTIGVLVDGVGFTRTKLLIKELVLGGILPENIAVLQLKKDSVNQIKDEFPYLEYAHLQWDGGFSGVAPKEFLSKKYDVLISYYDLEETILMQLTHLTKAGFKVGFASVDTRLHHFTLQTTLENHVVFVKEFFKILKLLNII